MSAFSDPVFLFSIFLFILCLAVILWASRLLSQMRSIKTEAKEEASMEAPHSLLERERIERLEKTLQSIELSHVEALRLLSARLDAIESSIREVKTKVNETASGKTESSPQPPPFV